MKFIDHGKGGPPDVMHVAEGPAPQPGPGEIVIKVAYAGVNRPDVAQRAGSYPPPPDASPYLGLEVAGTVSSLGEGASQWKTGDPVCALTPGGGYAEYVKVAQGHVLPVPKGFDLLTAAALPENYFTVWANVIERGRLQKGETFLVHGGSSGIGITAIQMAKAWGASVITTVGSDDKAAACRGFGADHVINYKTQDFSEEVARITGKRGVDVVLDMVGGPYIQKNLKLMAMDGRLVQIAFLMGNKAEVDFSTLMVRRLTYTGSTLRPRTVAEKTRLAEALRQQIWPLLDKGTMRPVIHKVFPLDQATAAHALMESSQHIGKIMLSVAP